MAPSFQDPRGDLSTNNTQIHPPASLVLDQQLDKVSPAGRLRKPNRQPCYDWIFTTATNVHVAIDKATFRTYTPFDSYVVAVANQQPVVVKGVGDVDLKIRCKPGRKENQVVTFQNVLHIPDWHCNIFSDIYFRPVSNYDYEWSNSGVNFYKKQNNKRKAWGYTESFVGLERLVLARKLQGRSPMSEDKDREVWSVNLHWPQYQRQKWNAWLAQQVKTEAVVNEAKMKERHGAQLEVGIKQSATPPKGSGQGRQTSITSNDSQNSRTHLLTKRLSSLSLDLDRRLPDRICLSKIDKNRHVQREPSTRLSSLKATLSHPALFKSARVSPGKADVKD